MGFLGRPASKNTVGIETKNTIAESLTVEPFVEATDFLRF